MTTTIKITTNGNHVAEGHITVWGAGIGGDGTTEVKVGPGMNKEFTVGVPSAGGARVELTEREATPDEIAALTGGAPAA